MTLAVIIPVFNSGELLSETLRALQSGTRKPDELIVVDDGSTDPSASIAELFGAQVIVMPHNMGPATCRNRAAISTHSDILVFLDADTCVHPETLELMELHFKQDPALSAVIGSYDEFPKDPALCSQYRNLAHCYVHHSANRNALTFWSGCGAVRRSAFLRAEGFDERYRRPSIEDIELGYRMSDRGERILLDPDISVTHTKRWTVKNSIRTDILDRGIPWMALLLERGNIPDDLNLRKHHRYSAILTGASFVCLFATPYSRRWPLASFALAAAALLLDIGLLRFLRRRGGLRLLFVGAALTLLQNLCKLVAAGGALLLFAMRSHPSSRARRGQRRSQLLEERAQQETESLDLPTLSNRI